MIRLVVLISGQGSNLNAILDACQRRQICGSVVAVCSNKYNAPGLAYARERNIPVQVISAAALPDRQTFDQQLMAAIDRYTPDLIVLAGYMRVLSAPFVAHYQGRIVNIHPSLLPAYPGLHTHRRAIANGDTEHGTSVHFATAELDGGPVILQAKVPIYRNDTEEEVRARVQQQEHSLYPLVLNWFATGRLVMQNDAAWLDGQRLPPNGYAAE